VGEDAGAVFEGGLEVEEELLASFPGAAGPVAVRPAPLSTGVGGRRGPAALCLVFQLTQ
jgi:hypothetical protein